MALVSWQDGPDLLAGMLRRYGQTPVAVTDTMVAWAAFAEFTQMKLAGIDTQQNSDSDGFILQWGRWSWNSHRPSMTFTRQVAVPCEDARFESDVQLWQINLVLFYEDSVVLSFHSDQDTGFYFPHGDEEWQAALLDTQDFPPVQAVAKIASVGSFISLEQVD